MSLQWIEAVLLHRPLDIRGRPDVLLYWLWRESQDGSLSHHTHRKLYSNEPNLEDYVNHEPVIFTNNTDCVSIATQINRCIFWHNALNNSRAGE